MKTAKEWREFYKNKGAIATCMSPDWLKEGCPLCGGKSWSVCGDYWVYCKSCSKGYPTDFPFVGFNQVEDWDFTDL